MAKTKKGFIYQKTNDAQNEILARKKFKSKKLNEKEFVIEKFKSGLFLISEFGGIDEETKQPIEKGVECKRNLAEVAEYLGLSKIIM